MRILLVYPPFCTPTTLPFSLASLRHFLQTYLDIQVDVLDLNAEFHKRKFPSFFQKIKTEDQDAYATLFEEFYKVSRDVYATNNKWFVYGKKPELFEELFSLIKPSEYNVIAFSLVFNSQCFYGSALLEELQKKGIQCIIGGPAAKGKVLQYGTLLNDEHKLFDFFTQKGIRSKEGDFYAENNPLDFSAFPEENYLSKERILPIKTSSTCFYKQCTFCTHFAIVPYKEYDISWLGNTIKKNNAKFIFIIDDMIAKDRLLVFAKVCKPLGIQWACQLRPSADHLGLSKTLYDGGLRSVSWGVESGSQRILNLMKKGTDVKLIPQVLKESHEAGIQNILYIMFAFPTETKEEYAQTIEFLEKNQENIDLVCTSIFGLQKGAKAYDSPDDFGIINIQENTRTVLEGNISYSVKEGIKNDEARVLQKKFQKRIDTINKIPKVFKYSREQSLFYHK